MTLNSCVRPQNIWNPTMDEFTRLLELYRRAVVNQSHGYPVGEGPGAWAYPEELDAAVNLATDELCAHVRTMRARAFAKDMITRYPNVMAQLAD